MKKKVILLIVLSLLLVAMCVFVFYMETAGAADKTLPNETVQAAGDNTEATVDLTDVPTEIPETERATTPFEGDEYTAPPMTFPPEEETVPAETDPDEDTKAPDSGNKPGSNTGSTQKPEATEGPESEENDPTTAPETEGSDPTEETGGYDEDELPPVDF